MNIGKMSMVISQSALASSVQLLVINLQMNMGEEIADGMTEMLENIAVDSIKGMSLDVRV